MNKTIALWEDCPEKSYWTEFEGRYPELDCVYINQSFHASRYEKDEKIKVMISKETQLLKLAFTDDGTKKFSQITREQAEQNVRDGAILISCGYIL